MNYAIPRIDIGLINNQNIIRDNNPDYAHRECFNNTNIFLSSLDYSCSLINNTESMACTPAGNNPNPHYRVYSIPKSGKDNKSLHPIWPLVQAFATCSRGAANAWPMVQTGELNRYTGGIDRNRRKLTMNSIVTIIGIALISSLLCCACTKNPIPVTPDVTVSTKRNIPAVPISPNKDLVVTSSTNKNDEVIPGRSKKVETHARLRKNFNKIKEGMTKAEVAEILGLSYESDIWSWEFRTIADKETFIVEFKKGIVISISGALIHYALPHQK